MATAKLHPKLKTFLGTMQKRTKIDMEDIIASSNVKMQCIDTGSSVINLLIGGTRDADGKFICPGWPRGKISEIFGRESSGKTTICLMAAGQAIQNGGTVLYVDLEHAVTDSYAQKLGTDFRAPELGGNGNAIRVCPHSFEETEVIVNGAAISGIDLIIVDSVAGLVSKKELQRDISDDKQKQQIAEVPRLMSAWMPKLQSIIAKTNSAVIFTNQTRDKIGAMGFTEETLKSTTGGNALKFWASLRMILKPKTVSKAKVFNPLLKEYQELPVSSDIEVKNVKNKIDARQGHSGLITIRYGVGIDELRTMMNVALAYNIVSKTKNKQKSEVFTFKNPKDGKVIESVGIEKFRVSLSRTEGALETMMELCHQKILEGFKAIDDSELAALAEDAVQTSLESDDDYDDSAPPEVKDVDLDDENLLTPSQDDFKDVLWRKN